MADEYIDKVEVGAKIQMMYIRREMDYGGENDFCRGMRKALRIIENTPSADVQPVKHGRWLSHHAIWIDQPKIEGWFVQAKCSECEKWAHVMNPYTKHVDYKQCPHCGARMDGEENV